MPALFFFFFFFAVFFKVPAGLVIKNGELSHSLCQGRHFSLAISLKGPCNEFFDWPIIPLPIPIPFPCSYWIGRDGSKCGIGRKRNSSDPSDSDSVELPTPLPIPSFDLHWIVTLLALPIPTEPALIISILYKHLIKLYCDTELCKRFIHISQRFQHYFFFYFYTHSYIRMHNN